MNRIITLAGLVLAFTFAIPAQAAGDMQSALARRFAAADRDHDGRLTRAEAEAGMPRVAQYFDSIDAAHAGYITLEQIEAYVAKMRG